MCNDLLLGRHIRTNRDSILLILAVGVQSRLKKVQCLDSDKIFLMNTKCLPPHSIIHA